MAEEKTELQNSLTTLQNNTMFRLSLSSKELFHSNFLAWVFEKYRGNIEELNSEEIPLWTEELKNAFKQDNVVEIKRENNLGSVKISEKSEKTKRCIADITIKYKNNNNNEHTYNLIIIENKFKSLPNKEQLGNYIKAIEKHNEEADNFNDNPKNNKKEKKYKYGKVTIILLSYFEPNFEEKDITKPENLKIYFVDYKDIQTLLNNLKIQDAFIDSYTECLNSLLELKEQISSLIESGKTYKEMYNAIQGLEEIADKMNLYKFIQKIFFLQLGTKLKQSIKGIDWMNCDVSTNQKIFIDLMVDCEKSEYTDKKIKSIGITIAEREPKLRHHIGIGKKESEKKPSETEDRSKIEERLNTLSQGTNLLNWFFEGCEGKSKGKNKDNQNNQFFGFDCLKDDDDDSCCWLYKKTTDEKFEFENKTFNQIQYLVKEEIDNITKNVK